MTQPRHHVPDLTSALATVAVVVMVGAAIIGLAAPRLALPCLVAFGVATPLSVLTLMEMIAPERAPERRRAPSATPQRRDRISA